MNTLNSYLAVILTSVAYGELIAQTDIPSEADNLIVAAHKSETFGDVVAAGKLFPNISEFDVSYQLTDEEGIRLSLLTRSPEKYTDRIDEIRRVGRFEIDICLPTLSRNNFSAEKLKQFRAKNGTVVFLRADWCPNCDYIEKKWLRKQSLLKFIYESNIPILFADCTGAFDGNGPVGVYTKGMGLSTVPAFVIYPPENAEPIVLTDVTSGEQIEQELKRHLGHHRRPAK